MHRGGNIQEQSLVSDPVADGRGDPRQLSGPAEDSRIFPATGGGDLQLAAHSDHRPFQGCPIVGESESESIERDDRVGGQLTR